MDQRLDILSAAGAHFESGVARRYGDPSTEYAALATVAAVDLSHEDHLRITGADAQIFLHRLLTCAVRSMAPGDGDRPFLLDARGRIKAALRLLRTDDGFLACCAPGHSAALQSGLDFYLFGEDVHFEDATLETATIGLLGDAAGSTLQALLGGHPSALDAHHLATLGETSVRVVRTDRLGAASYDLIFARADYAAVLSALKPVAPLVGADALERHRIERGRPVWPSEYGPHANPLEVSDMTGVTDGKGCYPGQEVVERILSRGRAPRRLVRLIIEGPTTPSGPLSLDGKEIGAITSVVEVSPQRWAALALVRSRFAQTTDPLRCGDASARIRHED